MSKATRATRLLEEADVAFTVHSYDYDPDARNIGLHAACALDEKPERVLKTLMTLVDGKPVCAIIPSDHEMSLKKLASAMGGKAARMMERGDAERISGYKIGGVSPFGQLRRLPTAIEAQALRHPLVYINAGRRGLQLRLDPACVLTVLGAISAPLVG
jgi:Cys-tRNA(Pro)/Cys-tRNA(Cys) deacylase